VQADSSVLGARPPIPTSNTNISKKGYACYYVTGNSNWRGLSSVGTVKLCASSNSKQGNSSPSQCFTVTRLLKLFYLLLKLINLLLLLSKLLLHVI
jgi:hypothetical protein